MIASMRLLAPLALACVLSACYTNVNRACFRKAYVGYTLNVSPEPNAPKYSLFRHGKDWYIAGVRSEVKDRDYYMHAVSDNYWARHNFELTPLPGKPVYYHKITPTMASWFTSRDEETHRWLVQEKVEAELRKAGGDWEPQLPRGAVAVPSSGGPDDAAHVQALPTRSPWYAYPLAGLTTLCVDVPCTLGLSTAFGAFTLWSYRELDNEED